MSELVFYYFNTLVPHFFKLMDYCLLHYREKEWEVSETFEFKLNKKVGLRVWVVPAIYILQL